MGLKGLSHWNNLGLVVQINRSPSSGKVWTDCTALSAVWSDLSNGQHHPTFDQPGPG